MKKEQLKRHGRAVCLLLALLLIAVSVLGTLSSCSAGSETVYTKEELTENVTRGATSYHNFVWQYLDEWHFPTFNSSKLKSVEVTFRDKYYKDIPHAKELSVNVGLEFLNKYYDVVDLSNEKAVTDAIIDSYVSSIEDPYAIYRTEDEYDDYSSSMSGKYTGIGIVVTQSDDGLILVTDLKEDGSAFESGVKSGDVITSVDGVPVAERGYRDSLDAISGKAGTSVTLVVDRGGESLTFTLERRRLVNSTVSYSLIDGIGYIRISSFKLNTDDLIIEAIDYMEANGARGIVYDLRNNTGGYLSSVLNALDYIAPKGTTLLSFSNDYKKDEVSKSAHTYLIPTVVLCNGMTASAAEIFVAGIRDIADMGHLDATIVGTKTFGKGIVQSTYTLFDGSTITMTVAYYMPPSGKNYHGEGITPDVTVEASETGDAQLDRAMAEIQALLTN